MVISIKFFIVGKNLMVASRLTLRLIPKLFICINICKTYTFFWVKAVDAVHFWSDFFNMIWIYLKFNNKYFFNLKNWKSQGQKGNLNLEFGGQF